MIQTETSKAKIIFVSAPNDIIAYGVHHAMDGNKRSFRVASETEDYELCLLPQGNWTILNVLDDVTEDKAEMVVESFIGGFKFFRCYHTIDNEKGFVLSATESLHSLATSLGVEGKTIILYQLK